MTDNMLKKKLMLIEAQGKLNYLNEYPKVYEAISYRTRGTELSIKQFIKEFVGFDYNAHEKRNGEVHKGSLKFYLTKEQFQKHLDAGLTQAKIGNLYGVSRQYIKKLHDQYFKGDTMSQTGGTDGNGNSGM